jgi:hypothetical protein
MHKSLGETRIEESPADNTTTLLMLENGSPLLSIRKILDDFGAISGLVCNYDKTVIMLVGHSKSLPKDLAGFTVANSIKLLGMIVGISVDNVDDIFLQIGKKILNLIVFWFRFRLSLAGRISSPKMLLIPLLTYLGCTMYTLSKQSSYR